MRKLTTILFFTCWLPISYAQVTKASNDDLQNEANQQLQAFGAHIGHMLKYQNATKRQKTTIQKQRLIGESSYNPAPNAYLYDTTIYQYSGINGSVFDFNTMQFNSSYPPTIEPAFYPYDYTSLDVMADTITLQSRVFSTDTLKTHYEIAATFSLSDKLTSYKNYFHKQGLPDSGIIYLHTYNAQGQLSELLGLVDTITAIDTALKLQLFYNAQGQREKDSLFSYVAGNWDPAGSVSYGYDAAGNITSVISEEFTGTSWIPQTKYEHTFYPDNNLMTATWYQYDGISFTPMRKDTFEYASGSSFFTTRTEFYMGQNGWTPSLQTSKPLNTQGVPDTVFYSFYNSGSSSWQHFEKQQYYYDADNNPLQRNWYSYDGVNWNLIETHNYYYEVFTVGITEAVKMPDIIIYPNPTNDEVTITWNKGIAERLYIEIFSTSGQQVSAQSFGEEYQTARLSTKNLASGLYFVILKDETGATLYNQRLIKQ